MIDLVRRGAPPGAPPHPVVVDIGAGPGSLAWRIADAMPYARVVAVEADPFLSALGRAWRGDTVEFVQAAVGAPQWRRRVPIECVDAVVASSVLHYPPRERLGDLLGQIREWLAPDGILVNADHFSDLDGSPLGFAPASDPWTVWWREALRAAELAPLLASRLDGWTPEGELGGDNDLSTGQHLELLRQTGFTDSRVAWTRGRSGVIVARR